MANILLQARLSPQETLQLINKEGLPDLLPKAHVVSLSPSPAKSSTIFFKKEE